jgi:hypothetical protein
MNGQQTRVWLRGVGSRSADQSDWRTLRAEVRYPRCSGAIRGRSATAAKLPSHVNLKSAA